MQSFWKLAITAASILASGSAIAQTPYYNSGPLPPNPPESWLAQGRSVQEWDRYRYDYSGHSGPYLAPIRLTRRVTVIFHRQADNSGSSESIFDEFP